MKLNLNIKNIKNIILKFRYIIEFFISILFTVFLAKTIFIKQYIGYYDVINLLITIILFIFLVVIIIYNFTKSEKKIERIFLNLAIPIGLIYLFFLIPGNVPDETAHFIKAYDISTGNLITPIDENGESYISVPKELNKYNHSNLNKYSVFLETIKNPTDYNDTEKTISTAQGNFFIMYVFSAIGFLISRILNINIIYGIFLGRTFNFIFFLLCSYLAIKKIPFGKIVFAIFIMTPICFQEVASISADAVLLGGLLYYIAYSIKLIFKDEKLTKKDLCFFWILTLIIGTFKMVYILLGGIIFLIIKRKDLNKKNILIIIGTTIILGALSVGTIYLLGKNYKSKPIGNIEFEKSLNINSSEQINQIVHEPQKIIKAIYHDWYYMGKRYIYMSIAAELGWLQINPSETIIVCYLILIITSALSEKNKKLLDFKSIIWLILIAIGIVLLTEIAMYIGVTPVGAEYILGVQGRYFIPIYILLLLCLVRNNNSNKFKNMEIVFPLIATFLNICVLHEVLKFFL